MSRFDFFESKFFEYKTLVLSDNQNGNKFEILFSGATPLNFLTQINDKQLNILDGFANNDEVKAGSGARCWIMTPFANRIPNGKYNFRGKEYQLDHVPPRTQVIHGFTSREIFELSDVKTEGNFIEVTFNYNKIRPGIFNGYPFAMNVSIKYKFGNNKIIMQVIGENVGDEPAPFQTGWHPYFKTSENGIENLVLSIDANNIVLVNDKLIPLNGQQAYDKIDNYPQLDFRSNIHVEKRKINRRIIDNCYAGLITDQENISRSKIFDHENGLEIIMFQKGGVTLVFTGDTLAKRVRHSIAVEPMQYITNAFNREELKDKVTVLPGEKSIYEFGFEIAKREK